ncbi:uncharacterized protein At1g76660 [Lactuca sativa]|uniref:Hydroxyproline-rich glycoprotein family protein n=1 Tax=Lactuca sativa TaxID=4236 RepID=A0A9R1UMA9_LACSA|nr:uncharacterized protein At1g76660 [Lactuca sativa]KAJ0190006.1 hypothetical protein LSAT_V11C800399350 [Lactuca sativa]
MASEQTRFLQHQQQQPASSRRKRWGGCLTGLSCFGLQKGGKRVVPASRMPETHATANQQNGPQAAGLTNQNNAVHPSLLAPPSSPASFSNSALQSTVQSPNCFLSANSPGGPSSTMFATGPYAHETQLVSPPVFSTFTTEPSTAPLTPPPELAHLTTPSSPDVPYAQFLSSTLNLKRGDKTNYMTANDLQATYSLYPGSPASTLRSPISRTSGEGLSSSFPDRDFSPQWNPSTPSQENKPQDANFFCPETFAQFYLDQSSFPHSGGRLSVSKESDAGNNNNGNGNGVSGVQSRPSKACKQDIEELEAYRASFGFSADEVVSTAHYVEISDVMDDSFSMMPSEGKTVPTPKSCKMESQKDVEHSLTDDEDIFSRMGGSRMNGKYHHQYHMGRGQSNSDAEVEYRRGRSLRESRGNSKW